MSQDERYGTRDRSYSAWHRRDSTRRFVGIERAQSLAMIDLDGPLFVEYDNGTKEPIALVETAMDVGQDIKPATVTKRLAKRCVPEMRAYVLLYKLAEVENPADQKCMDIHSFRAKRIWPEPETEWKKFSPAEWANELVKIRELSARTLDNVPI